MFQLGLAWRGTTLPPIRRPSPPCPRPRRARRSVRGLRRHGAGRIAGEICPSRALRPSYPWTRSGSASAYFFCPSRATPSNDWARNVVQASGCFFWRMATHSRRIGSASACLPLPEHVLRLASPTPRHTPPSPARPSSSPPPATSAARHPPDRTAPVVPGNHTSSRRSDRLLHA